MLILNRKMYPQNDTIVAISSAINTPAAIGIIRLSGAKTLEIITKIFEADKKSSAKFQAWHKYRGKCKINQNNHCNGSVYIFKEPNSYTTEDMAEIFLPGSPALLQMAIEQIVTAGARIAGPGEFTARAFLNGRIDLSEAEAVANVISAQNDEQLRAAERLLNGELHRKCKKITKLTTELLAQVEANIDFSEQDIRPAEKTKLIAKCDDIKKQIKQTLKNSVSWQQLYNLPNVMVAGAENSGKSCLTNALVGFDRSIVTNIAGTTRDLLTWPLELANGQCMLIDTAGFGNVQDTLTETAQQMSRKELRTCELILWVIDATKNIEKLDLPDKTSKKTPIIAAINKIDLCSTEKIEKITKQIKTTHNKIQQIIPISAVRGDNIERLKKKIEKTIHGELTGGENRLALNTREQQALKNAKKKHRKRRRNNTKRWTGRTGSTGNTRYAQ